MLAGLLVSPAVTSRSTAAAHRLRLLGLGEVTEVRVRGGGVETYLNLETGPALEFSNVDIDIHNYI